MRNAIKFEYGRGYNRIGAFLALMLRGSNEVELCQVASYDP